MNTQEFKREVDAIYAKPPVPDGRKEVFFVVRDALEALATSINELVRREQWVDKGMIATADPTKVHINYPKNGEFEISLVFESGGHHVLMCVHGSIHYLFIQGHAGSDLVRSGDVPDEEKVRAKIVEHAREHVSASRIHNLVMSNLR